jgi:hypothetical protein
MALEGQTPSQAAGLGPKGWKDLLERALSATGSDTGGEHPMNETAPSCVPFRNRDVICMFESAPLSFLQSSGRAYREVTPRLAAKDKSPSLRSLNVCESSVQQRVGQLIVLNEILRRIRIRIGVLVLFDDYQIVIGRRPSELNKD